MRTKNVKSFGEVFLHSQDKDRNYNFDSDIFSDGSGEFYLTSKKDPSFTIIQEDNGNIKEWLQEVREMKKAYESTEKFLIKLQETYNKAKAKGTFK
jgi:hypothetical protein